uniref:apocytochrome b n=1 Tax=Cryptomonas gyropyrenoidosa TaxID=233257 RepID=UPI00279F9C3F|nr:apocytochrome b [Cryptomonas gyropyrenoidosa]WFQ82675.1 apocytochrome b [Cryptomonas gyropyrenoidosa]
MSSSLRILNRPIINILNDHLVDYPTPANINYLWNFGSLAGVFLVVQILTGIFLAMHYTPHVDLAFLSVEHIMRDVNNGWFIRYLHANGASMFFAVVYIHIARGLFYGSYQKPRGFVWILGVVILILMMATAFMGYVLPWGQMSFWAATVITNLFSAFPIVGEPIVAWLWGGFSVDNATLNRFFSFHYLLPFTIIGAVLIHLAVLHQNGSNNPLGTNSSIDKIPFYPFFVMKDVFSWVLVFVLYFSFVYFAPNYLGHTDNYIEANPMITPAHIVPEWYFLPFYAILRSIPHKLGGVIAMFAALLILLLLPYLNTSEVRSSSFRPLHRYFFWLLVLDYFILGWIGGCAPESPYLEIGQIATFFYFFYFLVILPVLGLVEKSLLSIKLS